jgi:hypothetical protein
MATPPATPPATGSELADTIVDFVKSVLSKATVTATEGYGDAIQKAGAGAQTLIPLTDALEKFSEASNAGAISLATTTLKLKLFADAVETNLPKFGKEAALEIRNLSAGINTLAAVTEKETKIIASLGELVTGKFGTAFKNLAPLMTAAAQSAQEFEVRMNKLGQEEQVITNLRKQADELKMMGISYTSLKDAAAEAVAQINSSIKVNQESTTSFDNNRKSIQELLAFNKKFGIEMGESAKVVNLVNDAFGEGVVGANKFSDSIIRFAQKTGQDASKVFQAFNGQLDYFATMSSERALQAFSSLEAYAKRTGVEYSKVISNMQEFDDIASGYEKIGKINRLLMQFGASIDPQAFLEASPEEKQKLLSEAMAKAGETYGTFTSETAKRQIASQFAGLLGTSVQDAAATLSGNQEYIRAKTAALETKPTLESYTSEDRQKLAVSLSTTKDLQEVRDALFETTEAVKYLADGMRREQQMNINQVSQVYKMIGGLDGLLDKIARRNVEGVAKISGESIKAFGSAVGDVLNTPIRDMTDATKMSAKASEVVANMLPKLGKILAGESVQSATTGQ